MLCCPGAVTCTRPHARPTPLLLRAIAGGHSHTFLYGAPAAAGQPQVAGSPNPYITSSAREGTVASGPYPTNALNGNKTIPVVQALWGSR